MTKRAASGPFGTFCHHVTKVTKRVKFNAQPARFVTLVTKRAVVTKRAATDASKSVVKSLKEIFEDRPKIVNKIPPSKDLNLQAKRDLFSALVFSELVEDTDITFVAHENLHFALLKDIIRPENKGSSNFAGNLGKNSHRNSHNLFREKPRRVAGRVLQLLYIKHISSRVQNIVQELCESGSGRPGLSVLTSLLVSVDVKNY